MIKIFETLDKYNTYNNNGQNLESGDLYYVKEDNSTHYLTNNIDGVTTIYDTVENPTGNIEITANGTNIDVAPYSTATVDVPIPEGYIIPSGNKSITANGENIDVNDYATASVNVPVPPEYIIPTGNKSITENGENIDVAQYATATVNVAAQAKDYIVEGTEYDQTATYTGEFTSNKQIVSANIPSGFTSIGQNAFNGCTKLTSITIPNSVTSIGQYAFSQCTGLTTITIPNGVTSIGQYAFKGCTSLTSVTLPNSITRIEAETFYQCSGLTSITIPSGMTYIGSYAFYQCYGFTSVTVEATTPPSVFNNSFTDTNNCPIYVPAESVETYKTTGNWSTYASRIQAIPTT